jgi:hypothetical protein
MIGVAVGGIKAKHKKSFFKRKFSKKKSSTDNEK